MSNAVELVFIPIPGTGHMKPTVQLAKLILQRDERISISIHIINVSIHSAKVNAYVESQLRDNPYPNRLTFVTLPPLSNPPDPSTPNFYATTIELHKPLIKQVVVDRVREGFPKPAGFVLDMFCTVMMDIGNELDIPSYVFFTSGVNLLNLNLYAQTLADENGVDVATEFSRPEFSMLVPGFKNPVTAKVIPSALQDKEGGCDMMCNLVRKYREAKGILVNTYFELESFGIQTLLDDGGKKFPPVYPIGPVLDLGNESRGESYEKERESTLRWLDGQPESSVVFLCFGSFGCFDEEQVKEIANGLEKSGHRFLWALPKPSSGVGARNDNEIFHDALPEGFMDRTVEWGRIIGWAPQVEILAHAAIGGFVSHCGWNSTLEGLWFGVPIATWPMYADQQINAFSLVSDLDLAVEIRMDYRWTSMTRKGNFLLTADQLAMWFKKLMSIDEKMRHRIKEMSDKGKKALEDGGSSYNSLGHFIKNFVNPSIDNIGAKEE